MALRGWSWEAAIGPAGLGDRPLLEALEAAMPDETVAATIEATGTRERRRRRLPTQVVVTLVVAMGLWASESMRHVLAEVAAGWREGSASDRAGWQLPSTAAIVQARQRTGARLFRELFGAVARPIATAGTGGAFLGGLRLMAIDGTTVDVADTPENDRPRGRRVPPAPGAGADRDRHPRHLRRRDPALPDRGGADRPAPPALGRPRHAAAVGSGLPFVRDGPHHARPAGALPGADQEERRAPTDRDPPRWLVPGPDPPLPRGTPPRRAGDRPAGDRVCPGHPGRARPGEVPLDHLSARRAGLPRRAAGRDLPRAVGDRDRAGRGQGPPVGPPPPAPQQAPPRGRPRGLRPAARPSRHPHRDVSGRPARSASCAAPFHGPSARRPSASPFLRRLADRDRRRALAASPPPPQPPRRQTQDEQLPAQAPTAGRLCPNAAAGRRDLHPDPLALNLSVLTLDHVLFVARGQQQREADPRRGEDAGDAVADQLLLVLPGLEHQRGRVVGEGGQPD